MASSLEGPVDGSDVKAGKGALLKLGVLQGEDESDHVGPEVSVADTLGDADGELARKPSRRLGRQS